MGYGDRGPLTAGKTFLLAIGTVISAALGLAVGVFALFSLTFAESGNKTMALVPALLIALALAGAIAAGPLAWWFRSKRGLAVGAGVGVTLGLLVLPFV